VVDERHDDLARVLQVQARPDVDLGRAGVDEAVDELLGGDGIDLIRAPGRSLEAVRAGVVDVDVEPVLVATMAEPASVSARGLATASLGLPKKPPWRRDRSPTSTRGASGWASWYWRRTISVVSTSLRVPQRRQPRLGVCLSTGSQLTWSNDSAGICTPCWSVSAARRATAPAIWEPASPRRRARPRRSPRCGSTPRAGPRARPRPRGRAGPRRPAAR
jgi:hypothetical protein